MGVLNGTPDSFYPKSRIPNDYEVDYKSFKYCDILDIGFESSRPYAAPVSEYDELKRLDNFIERFNFQNIRLSIDTYKPAVAIKALENGFNIVNDIKSGGETGEMFEIASSFNANIVLMHMNGTPMTMQDNIANTNILEELLNYFDDKISLALKLGMDESKIIIDPGLGFGKSMNDNYNIINNLSMLKAFNLPLLLGLSRKSFLSVGEDSSENRLPASLGAAALAINNGANILRVHDIEETYRMVSIIDRILNQKIERISINEA